MLQFDNPRVRRRQRIKKAVACTVLGVIALALVLWFVPYSTPVRIEGPAWRMDADAGDDTSYTLSLDATYKRYLLRDDKIDGRMLITTADGRVVSDTGDDGDLGSPLRVPEMKDGKEIKGGKSVAMSNFFSWIEAEETDEEDGPSIMALFHGLYLAPDGKSAIISISSSGDGDSGDEDQTTFYAAPAASREEAQQIYDSINRILRISKVLPLD